MRIDLDAPASPPQQNPEGHGGDSQPSGSDTVVGVDAASSAAALTGVGAALMLPVDTIDEDPQQPRTEFNVKRMHQLADTVAQRGVRQPISVRPHPEQPGRWMLNMGARRLRASKALGETHIPAVVDLSTDAYDQVIENEQRENLTPLELALFVQRRALEGDNAAEVARRIGKSPAYITFVSALIDAPDWLLDLYRSRRCRGVTELYELRRLHGAQPEAVEQWLAARTHVTRSDVQALKVALKVALKGVESGAVVKGIEPASAPAEARPAELLAAKVAPTDEQVLPTIATAHAPPPVQPSDPPSRPPPASPAPRQSRSASLRSPALRGPVTLWARYEGADVTIDLGDVPDEEGCVFVLRDGRGDRLTAVASRLVVLCVRRP